MVINTQIVHNELQNGIVMSYLNGCFVVIDQSIPRYIVFADDMAAYLTLFCLCVVGTGQSLAL